MNRRDLLAATGGGTVLGLSGCLSSQPSSGSGNGDGNNSNSGGTEPSTEDPEIEPMEYPDLPSSLINESAVEFVEEYEEAHLHNDLLTEDTTDISIGCPAVIDFETKHGFYALTICHGSTRSGNTVGDLGPDPVFYRVTDDQFERIAERESGEGEAYGNGQGSSEVQGFRIVNFDETDHEMQLSLSHHSDSSETLVLEESYSLRAKSLYSISSVLATEGDFKFAISLNDGTTAKYEWDLTDIEPPLGINIYITKEGEIRFGTTNRPRF